MTSPKLVVIDYGLGNLASVANGLDKLGVPYEISDDPAVVRQAPALVLPGVGAAARGMLGLRERGLDKAIVEAVRGGTPIIGICLGMQLLLSSSEEGDVECLGLVPGKVRRFQSDLKIPQVGWNQVAAAKDSVLFQGLPADSYFYFVHSYYCDPDDAAMAKGITDYDQPFCSALEQGNVYGVQFHPEKSSETGLQLLRNFWEVAC